MLSIHPQYLNLAQLLSGRLFRVPEYQRAFSWTSKQRSELFEDILKTYNKGSDIEHFMAAVVVLRKDKVRIGTDVYHYMDIVDGQQRLTTLILLLKAIEKGLDHSDQSQKKNAIELAELLVKPDSNSLLLLQTNQDTSHYFATYLREGTHPEPVAAKTIADRELLSAMVDCESFVDKWKALPVTLPDLIALLKNRLAFILHEVQDEGTVYTVFEVLNSRGLVVPWLDRLKSILMGSAFELKIGNKAHVIEELHHIWRDIYVCVGLRQGMNSEALRFAATLKTQDCPNKPLAEEDAVEVLRGQARTAKEIVQVAKWVLTVTQAFDKIRGNRRLNAVTRISQARLLATAINLRQDLTESQKSQLLKRWEIVTFRIYGMLYKDARTRVGDYVRLAWRVARENLEYKKVLTALTEIGSEYPIEDAIDELRETDCYNDWQEELRYFFFRYEEHLAREQGLNFSNEQWERIWEASAADSIEHIWPQSKALLSQCHRLGNLILLPPQLNSKLSDKAPSEKRDAYMKTGLLIAQRVAQKLSKPWKKPAITKRENELLAWAHNEWAD